MRVESGTLASASRDSPEGRATAKASEVAPLIVAESWTAVPKVTAEAERVVATDVTFFTVSVSLPHGVGATKNQNTIAGRLMHHLNEKSNGVRYRVLNMGMGSWI